MKTITKKKIKKKVNKNKKVETQNQMLFILDDDRLCYSEESWEWINE